MRVLIACEFSGKVRDAMRERGHDAVSCDLLPSERSGPHIQGDVLTVLDQGWDLLIAHPSCTYLCNSGVRWLYGGKGRQLDPVRWAQMEAACEFFNMIWRSEIPKIAIENPTPHRYATDRIGDYTQAIHPWQFGHDETKRTCLWLKNLPRLQPTKIVPGRIPRVHHASPGPDRWKERSRTLTGIAQAMAEQWGC